LITPEDLKSLIILQEIHVAIYESLSINNIGKWNEKRGQVWIVVFSGI
jgi:hypothetical protein